MSATGPICWISATALARLGTQLDAVVQTWATAWGLKPQAPGAACALDHGELRRASASLESLGASADAGPWLSAVPGRSGELAGALFGDGSSDAPLAGAVAATAWAALVDAMRGLLRAHVPPHAKTSDRRGEGAAGHGGASWSFTIEQQTLVVIAPTAWLRASGCLARPSPRLLPAWSPAKALERIPITLTVELGVAEVSVGALSAIAVDDVLMASASTAEPIVLRAHDSALQLRAHLGRNGARRAVQVISTPRTATANEERPR